MGGAGAAPHPLVNHFYTKKIQQYIQRHTTNMQIHINICKNVEKIMKECFYRRPHRSWLSPQGRLLGDIRCQEALQEAPDVPKWPPVGSIFFPFF